MKSTSKKAETAYVSLYRKYRPETFADVVGQEHVTDLLEESIKQGKLGHAYLFCGSRGTGKTSVARIFARAIGTTPNDLYEIDAASNTSVEDIRSLNEAVNTIPFESKYKVYILDEVHMLSKSAFNAFLKTLEEPPKHVIFILATTEMEKLPETIVSRCQSFVFKQPTSELLKKVVLDISKKEGVQIESAAAELVALLGDGSFRDTLSILQKVLSLSGTSSTEITLAEVERVTGAPKSAIVFGIVDALAQKDITAALAHIAAARDAHLDMKVFSKLLLSRLRYLLLRSVSPAQAIGGAQDFTQDEQKKLDALKMDTATIVKALYAMLDASQQVGKSYISTLPLELAVVRLLQA
ncbi:MAG: hypothetical protein RL094_345 [Candidatus Parcubacteria bacterium]